MVRKVAKVQPVQQVRPDLLVQQVQLVRPVLPVLPVQPEQQELVIGIQVVVMRITNWRSTQETYTSMIRLQLSQMQLILMV